MKKSLIFFTLIFSVNIVMHSKELSIKMATSPIIIDGSDSESAWTKPEFQYMDQYKGIEANRNNTARFKMTYDSDFVYVYTEIFDATIDTSLNEFYKKDCIEIYISLDTMTSKSLANGTNSFYNLRKIFGSDFYDPFKKGFLAKEKEINGGIAQEWRLSWDSIASTLKQREKWNHNRFRFEILNTDCDSSKVNSRLFWNSNADDQWASISHQGYVATQFFLNINSNHTSIKSIKIEYDYISFEKKSDFKVFNISGKVVRQGYNSIGFSTIGLKHGIYILNADNQLFKFIK